MGVISICGVEYSSFLLLLYLVVSLAISVYTSMKTVQDTMKSEDPFYKRPMFYVSVGLGIYGFATVIILFKLLLPTDD